MVVEFYSALPASGGNAEKLLSVLCNADRCILNLDSPVPCPVTLLPQGYSWLWQRWDHP